MDKTLWVEAIAPSGAVGDIEIWEGYQPPEGPLQDGRDKVKATAVWANKTDLRNTSIVPPLAPLWGDVKAPMKLLFDANFQNFGKIFGAPQTNHINYTIGFEFTVEPPDIGDVTTVKFDITRQREKRFWIVDPNGQLIETDPPEPFPTIDIANDDGTNNDESVEVTNSHIYSMDGPGLQIRNNTLGAAQVIQRQNFFEFVRVSFDGNRPDFHQSLDEDFQPATHGSIKSSRCSPKIPWHSFMWIQAAPNQPYQERPNTQNDVELNHDTIVPPTP